MLPLKLSEVNLTWPKLIQQIQSDLFSVESKDLLGWCLIASVYSRAVKEGKHKLGMCLSVIITLSIDLCLMIRLWRVR